MTKLGDVCEYRSESVTVQEAASMPLYISTDSMQSNRGPVSSSAIPDTGKVKRFEAGDTLVSNIRPYFKKIWHAEVNGTCSNDILVFRPVGCTPSFLFWTLNSDEFFAYVTKTAKGTKMPRGDKRAIMEYAVQVPLEDEQRSLCQIMNSLQEKIALNNRTNDYLAETVMSTSRDMYWEYEAGNANLPAGWRWVRLDDVTTLISRGITPKYDENSDETVLGQTCIRGNLILAENGRRHRPKRINEKWLQRGDLLINSTGVGSLGRTAQVWFDPEKLTVDSHITIVRASDPEHALYLGFWAFAHERYIESLHTGSTGQTELPRDHVRSISLVLPDAETLDRFNTVAGPAVETIVANQAENKQLSVLRDALLPKLMSGEIDVSKVEIPTLLNNHLSDCSRLSSLAMSS